MLLDDSTPPAELTTEQELLKTVITLHKQLSVVQQEHHGDRQRIDTWKTIALKLANGDVNQVARVRNSISSTLKMEY